LKEIFLALPPKAIAARQIAVLYLLSQYSSTDNMIGNYPEELFIEEGAKIAMENFQKKLKIIGDAIVKRNDWDMMHPAKIPNSIAI